MRPKASLAATSGVGELAARESEAPNASIWDESVAHSNPHLGPQNFASAGLFVPRRRDVRGALADSFRFQRQRAKESAWNARWFLEFRMFGVWRFASGYSSRY